MIIRRGSARYSARRVSISRRAAKLKRTREAESLGMGPIGGSPNSARRLRRAPALASIESRVACPAQGSSADAPPLSRLVGLIAIWCSPLSLGTGASAQTAARREAHPITKLARRRREAPTRRRHLPPRSLVRGWVSLMDASYGRGGSRSYRRLMFL